MRIPTIALIDSNGDPDAVNLPIPGNDDAVSSIELIVSSIANAIIAAGETDVREFAPLAASKVIERDKHLGSAWNAAVLYGGSFCFLLTTVTVWESGRRIEPTVNVKIAEAATSRSADRLGCCDSAKRLLLTT